jgi:hypothetical protein
MATILGDVGLRRQNPYESTHRWADSLSLIGQSAEEMRYKS